VSGQQIHTVVYSELCADAVGVIKKATDFSRLKWSSRFEKAIRRVRLVNRDDQWRKNLSPTQQSILVRTLERAQAMALPEQ